MAESEGVMDAVTNLDRFRKAHAALIDELVYCTDRLRLIVLPEPTSEHVELLNDATAHIEGMLQILEDEGIVGRPDAEEDEEA